MVISRVLRHLLFVALCIPVVAKASTPVVAPAAAATGWTDLFPSKGTLGLAALVTVFFGAPALSKKASFNLGLGGYLKSAYNQFSRATNYVADTGSTWYGWARSLFYKAYDAPVNMQGAVYDDAKTNTYDLSKQAEVFGQDRGMSLPDAIAADNLEIVKKWLEKDPALQVQVLIENEAGDAYGRTGAMLAAIWGRDEIFKLFLRQTSVDQTENYGKTALHLIMNVNPRLDSETDDAYTEKLRQEDAKRANIIQELIDSRAHLHIADKQGKTPLVYLAENILVKSAQVFLQALKSNKARDFNEIIERDLISALEIAVQLNNVAFVSLFKKHFGMKYFTEQVMENAPEEIQNIMNAKNEFASQLQAYEQAHTATNAYLAHAAPLSSDDTQRTTTRRAS